MLPSACSGLQNAIEATSAHDQFVKKNKFTKSNVVLIFQLSDEGSSTSRNVLNETSKNSQYQSIILNFVYQFFSFRRCKYPLLHSRRFERTPPLFANFEVIPFSLFGLAKPLPAYSHAQSLYVSCGVTESYFDRHCVNGAQI